MDEALDVLDEALEVSDDRLGNSDVETETSREAGVEQVGRQGMSGEVMEVE